MGLGPRETELYNDAGARVLDIYRRRIESQALRGEEAKHLRKIEEIERKLRLTGIRAERDAFYQLSRSRALSDETMRKLVREADLLEARLTGG